MSTTTPLQGSAVSATKQFQGAAVPAQKQVQGIVVSGTKQLADVATPAEQPQMQVSGVSDPFKGQDTVTSTIKQAL